MREIPTYLEVHFWVFDNTLGQGRNVDATVTLTGNVKVTTLELGKFFKETDQGCVVIVGYLLRSKINKY